MYEEALALSERIQESVSSYEGSRGAWQPTCDVASWLDAPTWPGRAGKRWEGRALAEEAVEGGYEEVPSVLGVANASGKAGLKVEIPLARQMLARATEQGESLVRSYARNDRQR